MDEIENSPQRRKLVPTRPSKERQPPDGPDRRLREATSAGQRWQLPNSSTPEELVNIRRQSFCENQRTKLKSNSLMLFSRNILQTNKHIGMRYFEARSRSTL